MNVVEYCIIQITINPNVGESSEFSTFVKIRLKMILKYNNYSSRHLRTFSKSFILR